MKYLSITEIKAMLREVPNTRHRLCLLIGFWHGLRASEIIALKGADIRDGHVDVKRLKGSMHTIQRYQYHPDPELDESGPLTELASRVAMDERLMPMTRWGILKVVKRACKKAGINAKKAKTHTLKHSCAMTVIGSGIENARQRLGHKSLSSTGAYLRVTDDRASDAIDAFLGVQS